MSTLTVTVKEKTNKGQTSFEGSYQLPSSSVTKLQRKDGTYNFQNRSSLTQTANRLAKAIGWKVELNEPAKKAAKKSVKAKTKAKTKAKVQAKPLTLPSPYSFTK